MARPHDRILSRRPGIRLSATWAATAVVAVVLALSGTALVGLVHRSLVDNLDAATYARALDVAALARSNRLRSTVASVGEEIAIVQVVDRWGSVRSASGNVLGEDPVLATPPITRARVTFTRTGLPVGVSGESFRIVAEPVAVNDGPGWVYVATSLRQTELTIHRLTSLLLLGLPLLLLVVAAAIWGAVGRALRPVERIRDRAAAIGGSDLQDRVPVPRSQDEIARLAVTMNDMLARLEDAALRQRRFIGDASHELRSPLAAMRAQVDVHVAHPDSASSMNVLQNVQEQTQRMSQLIDDLLFLARADEQTSGPATEIVDLDELILTEARRLRSLGGRRIEVTAVDAARVTGASRDLTRMLRNLGDNAMTYARSVVTIRLTVCEHEAALCVADDGPGLPPADRDRIFERFARTDEARSRLDIGTGAGLGLSISRQIARAHGGEVSVLCPPGHSRGAAFVVTLPLLATTDPKAADRPGSAVRLSSRTGPSAVLRRRRDL